MPWHRPPADLYAEQRFWMTTRSTAVMSTTHVSTTTTVLRPFFRDHPGEPVPEENFWTLWRKGRLTEADTLTIRLSATPFGLTSSHLHHPPIVFTGQMPFLLPNQQCQSTEGNTLTSVITLIFHMSSPVTQDAITIYEFMLFFVNPTLHNK